MADDFGTQEPVERELYQAMVDGIARMTQEERRAAYKKLHELWPDDFPSPAT